LRSVSQIATNFHWVVPGEAARSAQVPAVFLRPLLKAHGIKSMINLRGAHPEFRWWRKEEQTCLKQGVRYLNAMLDSRLLPTKEMLIALWTCFDRARDYGPLLIKCSGGQDRTSLAAALYLIERHGWAAMDQAEAQFKAFPYLHFPRANQRWLKAFLRFAQEDAQGRPIREWLQRGYDPVRLAGWLVRGLGPDSCAGIYKQQK
jgi:protein tyrosine/serine phosphatase